MSEPRVTQILGDAAKRAFTGIAVSGINAVEENASTRVRRLFNPAPKPASRSNKAAPARQLATRPHTERQPATRQQEADMQPYEDDDAEEGRWLEEQENQDYGDQDYGDQEDANFADEVLSANGMQDRLKTSMNLPICFAKPHAKAENLKLGVAAWQLLGNKNESGKQGRKSLPDILATYIDGRAFCGTLAQWNNYCELADCNEDWALYGVKSIDDRNYANSTYDPQEIAKMKGDTAAFRKLVDGSYDPEAMKRAHKQHAGWGWHQGGDPVTVITEVPGVQGPLVFLGTGENIIYRAKKGGEFCRFTHEFGEGVKVAPSVYAIAGQNVLVIHGGDMTVEDRGIVR